MPLELNDLECRVIGCLMEKSVLTPDQYPMTLNALTNACNQKSSRDPVMALTQGEVQHTLRALQQKHVVRSEENFKSQVEKFGQRLCNTPFSDYQLDPAQFAIMTVLLLRGPRTPGELRSNSGRLHTFADNGEVEAAIASLIDSEQGTLVAQLPRTPGRRDSEYMHLWGGEIEAARVPPQRDKNPVGAETTAPAASVSDTREQRTELSGVDLAQRVKALERELAEVKATLARLNASDDPTSGHVE